MVSFIIIYQKNQISSPFFFLNIHNNVHPLSFLPQPPDMVQVDVSLCSLFTYNIVNQENSVTLELLIFSYPFVGSAAFCLSPAGPECCCFLGGGSLSSSLPIKEKDIVPFFLFWFSWDNYTDWRIWECLCLFQSNQCKIRIIN